jgi:hypothetical protein
MNILMRTNRVRVSDQNGHNRYYNTNDGYAQANEAYPLNFMHWNVRQEKKLRPVAAIKQIPYKESSSARQSVGPEQQQHANRN